MLVSVVISKDQAWVMTQHIQYVSQYCPLGYAHQAKQPPLELSPQRYARQMFQRCQSETEQMGVLDYMFRVLPLEPLAQHHFGLR